MSHFLEHPVGTQIEGDNRYDYSHMLAPEHRAAGYGLVIEHGNDEADNNYVNAEINHQGNYVGGINAYMGEPQRSLVDPRQTHRPIEFFLSDLEDEHQGKGLGPAAYKAAIVHAKNVLGATHIKGGKHSTAAHRVHQKIANELGVPYHADENPEAKDRPSYNEKYLDYEYPIQPPQTQPLMQSEPLMKAIADNDFKSVVGALDPAGSGIVDHSTQLRSHPPTMETDVGKYAQNFLHNPSLIRKVKGTKLGGISKKLVVNDGMDQSYMVKPYHERVTKVAKPFMHRAHQGWAEMANQSLFHAAGLGQMHQKVHVAEHNMGPGHENEPGVVVHFEPGMDEVTNMQPQNYHPSMASDATKIAAMDFLANNIDRHGHNLLFRKNHGPAQTGSRLLAIDHGRNFQYKVGTGYQRDKNNDSLYDYFTGGIQHIRDHARRAGGPQINNAAHFVPEIRNWWPAVRANVVKTMHDQVGALKNQAHRDHIWKNFTHRVGMLDDMCRFPDEFIDGDSSMFQAPIFRPGESVNAYNPWQREH